MDFIKKNLVFCIFILIALLAFAAGLYMALSAAGSVSDAEGRLSSAKQQRNALLSGDPAPTEANVEASAANVEALRAQLADIREDLQRGSRINVSDDPIRVMAGIQQYISDFKRKAVAHVPEIALEMEDEEEREALTGIDLPEDFAFGFERYSEDSEPPSDPRKVALLDKQRQILTYLMNQLIEADPEGIRSVRRELVEVDSTAKGSADGKGFQISPAVSAREPGAINTMAFSISFVGKTDALRNFLNELAGFELPIVVRSIEVNRPSGSEAVVASSQGGGGLEDIFGAFGGGGDDESADSATDDSQGRDPIIENIDSTFTIILEFIEIVLPESEGSPANNNEDDLS